MTKDMTIGNPLKLILLFSLPVLFGESVPAVLQHGRYHHCRTVFREDALAAVGATGSIMFLVLGFASGLAQGFGVMVSQAFGAKDESRLKAYCCFILPLNHNHFRGSYRIDCYYFPGAFNLYEHTG